MLVETAIVDASPFDSEEGIKTPGKPVRLMECERMVLFSAFFGSRYVSHSR